jgi:gamma-glutamylcyclotransferase (GGCT)/AIG2-like uncharacterized protein YtfP
MMVTVRIKGSFGVAPETPFVSNSFSDSFWLFVYGSLKTGECNHSRIQSAVKHVEPGRTPGKLLLRTDGYPAMLVQQERQVRQGTSDADEDLKWAGFEIFTSPEPPGNGGLIEGQLLELVPGASMMAELDRFEGFLPGQISDYERALVIVLLDDGRSVGAWVYVCSLPEADWCPIDFWPPPGHPQPEPYVARA